MAGQPTLKIEPRPGVGSGDARKLRRQGRIPAVLYGHGEPEPVSLDLAEFRHAVTPEHYGSFIVRVRRGGKDAGVALVKAVQATALGRRVLSVDLQRVTLDEQVHVAVPVVLEGTPEGARAGGVLEQAVHAINLRCQARNVPQQITHDISHMNLGDSIHVRDLAVPANTEVLDNPEEMIAVLLAPTVPVAAELPEAVAEAAEKKEEATPGG